MVNIKPNSHPNVKTGEGTIGRLPALGAPKTSTITNPDKTTIPTDSQTFSFVFMLIIKLFLPHKRREVQASGDCRERI